VTYNSICLNDSFGTGAEESYEVGSRTKEGGLSRPSQHVRTNNF